MWICVGPHDPATKPIRGCLRVVELSAIPQLPQLKVPGEDVITKKTFRFVGCAKAPCFSSASGALAARAKRHSQSPPDCGRVSVARPVCAARSHARGCV